MNTPEIQWYLGNPEAPKGPYSTEMIRKGILSGKLSARLKILRSGTNTWIPLNEIPDFVDIFAPTTAVIRWFVGSPGAMRGPYTTEQVQQSITNGKLSPFQQATKEGSSDWKTLNEISEFIDACMKAPFVDANIATAQKIIEEFRQTDFKSEIIPVDESNYKTLLKDTMFWVILTLGILPLIITSFNDVTLQFVGMLFFFAMFWGGLFRGVVLKSNEKVTLPITAFFFTGFIGMPLLLYAYQFHPEFYITSTDHKNPVFRLLGSILHTGVWEESIKILPVIIYLGWKQRKAQPLMIILIGVFSGLGFAAFENIQYGKDSIKMAAHLGLEMANQAGEEGLVIGVAGGTLAAMINVMLRSISCVFGHAIWSGIFAYYLTRAMLANSRWYVLGFLGLTVPAALHGTYNWFCEIQPAIAALVMAVGFVLFYGYLAKLRQDSLQIQ